MCLVPGIQDVLLSRLDADFRLQCLLKIFPDQEFSTLDQLDVYGNSGF